MGLFSSCLILVRGGGDLATGVVSRLFHAGFPVIVLELAHPLVVRRAVALASAVHNQSVQVEDLTARRVEQASEAQSLAHTRVIPVLVAPELTPVIEKLEPGPMVIIDARLAKRNIDTSLDQAPLVIALGPGFTAGLDCHAVVETMRGHGLGRVIWQGAATANTGTPGIIGGKGVERVLRAPNAGKASWDVKIGSHVEAGQRMGHIGEQAVVAPFSGVVRGLIAPATTVPRGLKIGDIDARGDEAACFTISDKALAVGGGVLEAVLTFLNRGQLLGNPS